MTTPKQALELKPCPFCGGEAVITQRGNNLYSTVYECTDCRCRLSTGETFNYGSRWNTRATASLQGEDAVERVAATIRQWTSHGYMQLHAGEMTAQERRTVTAVVEAIERQARAILATGLVPDEAAIRAATSDMLLAGARSLGNTMGKPNFMQRAQACWDAMWKAKDGVVEPKPAAIRSGGGE